MTMDKIAFARLIAYIIALTGADLSEAQIMKIDSLTKQPIPEPRRNASPAEITALFEAMLSDRKIEAIKIHRTLTGYGLKESKDAVESLMARIPNARLSDILPEAGVA